MKNIPDIQQKIKLIMQKGRRY